MVSLSYNILFQWCRSKLFLLSFLFAVVSSSNYLSISYPDFCFERTVKTR